MSVATAVAFALVANATNTNDTAPPNGIADFRSVKEIVDLVPPDAIMQLKVPARREAAKTDANLTLARYAVGKWVSWKVKVGQWPAWDSPWVMPNKSRIDVPEQAMNVDGTVFGVRMMVYLGAEAEPIAAKLHKGDEVTMTSYLHKAAFTIDKEEGLTLNLGLSRTQIEPK